MDIDVGGNRVWTDELQLCLRMIETLVARLLLLVVAHDRAAVGSPLN